MKNTKEKIREISSHASLKHTKNFDNFREGDLVQYSGQLWDKKNGMLMSLNVCALKK